MLRPNLPSTEQNDNKRFTAYGCTTRVGISLTPDHQHNFLYSLNGKPRPWYSFHTSSFMIMEGACAIFICEVMYAQVAMYYHVCKHKVRSTRVILVFICLCGSVLGDVKLPNLISQYHCPCCAHKLRCTAPTGRETNCVHQYKYAGCNVSE